MMMRRWQKSENDKDLSACCSFLLGRLVLLEELLTDLFSFWSRNVFSGDTGQVLCIHTASLSAQHHIQRTPNLVRAQRWGMKNRRTLPAALKVPNNAAIPAQAPTATGIDLCWTPATKPAAHPPAAELRGPSVCFKGSGCQPVCSLSVADGFVVWWFVFEASLARWKNQGWKTKKETNLSDVGGKGGDKGVGEAHGGCGGLDRISLWKSGVFGRTE